MGSAQRRARPAILIAVALFVAACTSPAANGPRDDTSNAAGESSTTPGESPSVTYAEHTVEPPGPFDSRPYGDDLLLVSEETIPDELVERIKAVKVAGEKGVTKAEPLSIGQFSAENKSYRIAAVDPAGYRAFTPGADSPEGQQAWERVAGGEIAVRSELNGRLPLDEHDYLAVGSGETAFPIHVGAYAAQVGTVDAVVNTSWGDALGIPEDNALLIYTGDLSPQAVRKQLRKIVGDMSITDLDAVAEYGLELNSVLTASFIGTFAEAVGVFRYTPIGGGRVQPAPAWVREHIVTEQMPIIGSMTCNKHMMPQLRAALETIAQRGLADKIHPGEYAGCYYPRYIAGSTTLSNHSFGLAFDINVPGNQRGTVGEIDRDVVAIFKEWGFAWGGDWSYTDPMHFELREIVRPS